MDNGRRTTVRDDRKKVFDDDELDVIIAKVLRIPAGMMPFTGDPRTGGRPSSTCAWGRSAGWHARPALRGVPASSYNKPAFCEDELARRLIKMSLAADGL